MVTEREQQALERTRELLEQVDATLALPRFEGALWALPEPETREAPPAPRKAPPAPGPKPVAYMTRKAFDRAFDSFIKAVAEHVTHVNNRLVLRFREDERRLDAIEARLARLEAQGHG